MRFLRSNTATRLTVGPFFDKTDGVTPETALTVTACKLTFTVDDGGVPTLVLDTNPTASGGSNDMVHITGDDAGYYDLELTAANVNYVGRAHLALTDAATHCPVFHEFTILPEHVYDSLTVKTGAAHALGIVDQGTAQSATSSTIVLRSAAAFADDEPVGMIVVTTGGTGVGQARVITDYVSSTDTATVSPNWQTTPSGTIEYKIFAAAPAPTASGSLPPVNVEAFGGVAGTFASGIPEVKTASIATGAVSTMLTTQMTEAYAADGAAPTLAQALMMIQQMLGDFAISGTTLTVKKVDGSTTAATYTLNDSASPTSITRST
jgi:hypothetical protein